MHFDVDLDVVVVVDVNGDVNLVSIVDDQASTFMSPSPSRSTTTATSKSKSTIRDGN
jgi:hypothetical protein